MMVAIMTTALTASAAEEVYSTCLFGTAYNSKAIGSYTATWTATNGDFTWTIVNGNNNNNGWAYIKFGRKNTTSVGELVTSTAYPVAITKVDLTIDAITAANVNSINLYTSADNSTWTEAGSFSKATGTQTVNLATPTANLYYKIEFDCASGSANGLVTVSKVEYYYNTGGAVAPSINAADVSVAYDATGGEIAYTVNNPVTGGTLKAETSSNWLAVGTVGNTIPFNCDPNNGAERGAIVTLTYAYGSESVTKNVTVTQAANPNGPGSEANPYTVAQARAAIDANTGLTEVYATGIVSAIPTAWSTQYNNITFNFVDATGDEDFLQAFRCVSGTGVDASTVAVGDIVVVKGNLTKYGTTYEFAQGCELISLTHPTAAVEAPIFSPDGGVFTTPQSVSFAVAAPTMEGYTFYYTLDGTEPTTESTLYTGPIEVSTTTTIKAIAVKGGEVSLVTTATYAILAHAGTEADPYSVADAHAAIDANAGLTDVYATGVVTEIATAWSTDHSNISFNFVDAAGDGGSFLQAYRCVSTDAADASTVQVGDVVVVKGTLKLYGATYEFGAGCQLVSLTHSGTPADPVIVAENATIDAGVTHYELMYEIQNPVDGTELTASTTASWITSCTPSQKSFDRVMIECEANETTEDRTATIVLTYGTLTKEVTLTQKGIVAPITQFASLPFSFDGGKADIEGTEGLTQDGLGADYKNSPYLKFDGTGDYLLLAFDERPGELTFNIQGNSFSGGTFKVMASEDGEEYGTVATYTELGSVETKTITDLGEDIRYIKWVYTEKVTGNVALGNINLAKYEEPAPALYVRPNEIAATADGATGTLTITAEGITLTPNDQLYIEFHDADGGPLPAAPDWITTEVTTGEAGFVVNYTIAANQGEARSTFFQVVAAEYKLFSNVVTVSQEAYVAPATGDQFALYSGDLVEGDYIIYYDGKAMSNKVANNRLQYAEVTPENDIITTDNEAIVWHIAPSGEYWTIYSPAAKAYAASNGTKNQAQMLVDADDHALWSVEAMATHVAHEFTNKGNAAADVNAVLRNNGTYGFACYSVNTGGAVQLYKKVESFVPTVQTVTVTDAGYATFVAEKNLEIPTDVQVEVFAVTVEGSYASLQPIVGNIPAGEAVLVKASAGDYNFLSAQTADPIRVNKLVAATTDVVADGTQYVLANGASGIGFYQATPGSTIPAGKAYLVVTAAGVKPFYGFEDDATGIEMVNGQSSMVNDPIFNLAGQRLQKMQRGINIIGGKKVLK